MEKVLNEILKKVDIIKAEQENIKHDVAEIKGEIKNIRKSLLLLNMLLVKAVK